MIMFISSKNIHSNGQSGYEMGWYQFWIPHLNVKNHRSYQTIKYIVNIIVINTDNHSYCVKSDQWQAHKNTETNITKVLRFINIQWEEFGLQYYINTSISIIIVIAGLKPEISNIFYIWSRIISIIQQFPCSPILHLPTNCTLCFCL